MNLFGGLTSKQRKLDAYLPSTAATQADMEEKRAACRKALNLQNAIHGCMCPGPMNGQPVCPCQMRNVVIRDGRWIMTKDLGPAPTVIQPLTLSPLAQRAIGVIK